MMTFWILLAYAVIAAIWVGMLIVLNHKAGDVFEWEGEDDGTTFLWILFIAACWPFAAPVACAITAAAWLLRSHGEDSDD